MDCPASNDAKRRRVSRYSVSLQEESHITEVTPLLQHQRRRPQQNVARSVGDIPGHYESDEDFSECELADDHVISINGEEAQQGSRSFTEGTAAILQYDTTTTNGRRSVCVHGKSPRDCCNSSCRKQDDNLTNSSPEAKKDGAGDVEGHCHSERNKTSVDKVARRRLLVASMLCLVFMVGEVVGGYIAGSLAIMTDAAHLLTDFASFMISLFALWVGSRPATKQMSFGWYRAEVIGALTSVLLIWVVTGILVYLAIQRIVQREYDIDAVVMLITAAVGVLVNLVMGLTLHSHGHSHGGSRSSGDSEAGHGDDGPRGTNINVRAALIHVIGDFIQSVGILAAAIVIYFKPEWAIADPICTFLFSVLVLLTTFAIMQDTLTVLMEGLPKGVDFSDVQQTFVSIAGVVQVHNLRIWALSMEKVALSAHLVISPGTNPRDVLRDALGLVRRKYSFFEMTLQIEDLKEEMVDCKQCQGPTC